MFFFVLITASCAACANWQGFFSWQLHKVYGMCQYSVCTALSWGKLQSSCYQIKTHQALVCCRCIHFFFTATHSNGQAIIFCSCGYYFLSSSFFLACFQQSEIGCLPYFHTWCGLSANLECRSGMCCTRLAEDTGCKNYIKNHHLRTIAQLCQAISSQLRHVSTVGKNTC